jgi:serine incorporator 1/3
MLQFAQGAAVSTSLTMGATYGCMAAVSSLCQACLGSTSAGTTGRKRSVLFLTWAILLAWFLQYSIGPAIVTHPSGTGPGLGWMIFRWIPGMGRRMVHSWQSSCPVPPNATKDEMTAILVQCAGNAGVYRSMSMAALFFAASAIATYHSPMINRQVWPAKFTVYTGLVLFSVVCMDNAPWFTGIFLWLARIGATVFMLLQQVILIDVAYNWNEDWVDKAEQADRLDYGSGAVWLQAIVAACVIVYSITLGGIIWLYSTFADCPENSWIITLTLLAVVGLTALQLSGHEGSLLTSSLVSLYATYLAYSMVSKNPNETCNPFLGTQDVTGIVMGLTLTAISLAWTGWSWTAQGRLDLEQVQRTASVTTGRDTSSTRNGNVDLDLPFLDPEDRPTSGMVMEGGQIPVGEDSTAPDVWKLNVVMVLIACFVAMILTGWGTLESKDAANPTVGRFNMAMIGVSQWLAILLYVWTLVAPRLFPDRDFS